MKMFLPNGYTIPPNTCPTFKNTITSIGQEAEQNLHAFMKARGCGATSVGTTVKWLKREKAAGSLAGAAKRLKELLDGGAISDPVPVKFRFELQLAS